ncbi:MAG: hypothetical protein AAGA54_10210 [Myxococcota bacterium]
MQCCPKVQTMNTTTPETEALDLLRAMFDLADADIRVTVDLLSRLAGHDPERVFELLSQLRSAKLVQPEALGLTMLGLTAAVALPEFQPSHEPARKRLGLRAA